MKKSKLQEYIVKSPYELFSVITIILLYVVAIVSFLAAILFSDEWKNRTISMGLTLGSIVIPIIAITAAFGVQIILLFIDSKTREKELLKSAEEQLWKSSKESKFLQALEQCNVESGIRRVFLGYHVQEWAASMENISNGRMTIHKDYWDVCAELNRFAHKIVECTSVIPIEKWHKNSVGCDKALIEYKNDQKTMIRKNIEIKRTFILTRDNTKDKDYVNKFYDVVSEHAEDGFILFYLILDDIMPAIKERVEKDFSVMDNNLVMIGRLDSSNRNIYYYDFYDLTYLVGKIENRVLFGSALELFSNIDDIFAGQMPKPIIAGHRDSIEKFPSFSETQKRALLYVLEKRKATA